MKYLIADLVTAAVTFFAFFQDAVATEFKKKWF